jgi:hypothetical protein
VFVTIPTIVPDGALTTGAEDSAAQTTGGTSPAAKAHNSAFRK